MRAKFYVTSVTDYGHSKQATLSAQYSSGKPEDNEFAAATPSGKIEITISNPAAMDYLKVGKKYYVDFSEAVE